jgi:hypothetical protein
LHDVHPQTLFATCLSALAARIGFDPAQGEVLANKQLVQ